MNRREPVGERVTFSEHQGVEDDDRNVMCLDGLVAGSDLARDQVRTFLSARFRGEERFKRRFAKMSELENKWTGA